MIWDAAAIRKLGELWGEGLSAQRIADQLGTTKNSTIGKSHRLGLPARPSPIHRDPNAPPPVYVRRAPAITLPKLASIPTEMIVRLEPHQAASLGKRPTKPPAPTIDKEPEQVPEVVVPSPYKTCQWITSNGRPWTFCGDTTDPRHGTYCAKHARLSRGSTRFLDSAA